MLIDFFEAIISQYWEDGEKSKLGELDATRAEILREVNTLYPDPKTQFDRFIENKELASRWDQTSEEEARLVNAVIDRYRDLRGSNGIIEDIKTVLEALEKEDYTEYRKKGFALTVSPENEEKATLRVIDPIEGDIKEVHTSYTNLLKNRLTENYTNCLRFVLNCIDYPLALLSNDNKGEDPRRRAVELAKEKVALWYDPEDVSEVLEEYYTLWRSGEKEEPSLLPSLPKYDFVYPTELQQNLTKASKKIFDSSIAITDLKQAEIDVTPNKKGIVNTFSVYVDMSAPELKGTENVTEYDKSVHNMAVSIGLANKHGFFTARELATALIHGDNPNNNRVSSQQIGAVTKSIEKQRHIDITIDWTEHIKLNHKGELPEDASNFTVKDYMLPVREYTATIGGKTLHGYQFIDPIKLSPLYQYARSVGQIGQHPVKMLNIPINLDQSKLVIRDFLLEEIAHIKNNPTSWNNTISVDKILEVAGEDSQTITRKKKSSLLFAVKDMLDYWKKEGYIKGYTENRANTTGKPIQSFTILT